jgi:hypothetical protein
MRRSKNRSTPWLPIVGAMAFLAGAAVLVLGLVSLSGATADREDAEATAADRRSVVEDARGDLSDAEAALSEARAEGIEARTDLQDAEATLEDTRAAAANAQYTLEDLRSRVPGFVAAAGDLTANAAALMPGIEDLASRLSAQAEAILGGDHPGFNELRAAYLDSAVAVAGELDALAGRFDDLPEMPIPFRYDGSPLESDAPDELQTLDPPTGPAVITVELPDVIPCEPWGDGGCHYSWRAEFVESNWLAVTITKIGVRYRRGRYYCTIGYSGESTYEREWDEVDLWVPPGGSESEAGSLFIDPDNECWPIRGGELLIRWEGTDAEGNRRSGRGTASLESPS